MTNTIRSIIPYLVLIGAFALALFNTTNSSPSTQYMLLISCGFVFISAWAAIKEKEEYCLTNSTFTIWNLILPATYITVVLVTLTIPVNHIIITVATVIMITASSSVLAERNYRSKVAQHFAKHLQTLTTSGKPVTERNILPVLELINLSNLGNNWPKHLTIQTVDLLSDLTSTTLDYPLIDLTWSRLAVKAGINLAIILNKVDKYAITSPTASADALKQWVSTHLVRWIAISSAIDKTVECQAKMLASKLYQQLTRSNQPTDMWQAEIVGRLKQAIMIGYQFAQDKEIQS